MDRFAVAGYRGFSVVSRKEFPAKVCAQAALRSGGICEAARIPHVLEPCSVKLSTGNIFYEHINCDGLTGEPTLENCAVLCKACWLIKTRQYDLPVIAKAKRVERAHLGIRKRTSRPMPGSKRSGVRKRMSGAVERWPADRPSSRQNDHS